MSVMDNKSKFLESYLNKRGNSFFFSNEGAANSKSLNNLVIIDREKERNIQLNFNRSNQSIMSKKMQTIRNSNRSVGRKQFSTMDFSNPYQSNHRSHTIMDMSRNPSIGSIDRS